MSVKTLFVTVMAMCFLFVSACEEGVDFEEDFLEEYEWFDTEEDEASEEVESEDVKPEDVATDKEEIDIEESEEAFKFTLLSQHTASNKPPIVCSNQKFIGKLKCHGPYCGGISADCHNSGVSHGTKKWTWRFSEESPRNYGMCPSGMFVSSIYCSGRNCDNLNLLCTEAKGKKQRECRWTGWYSEEDEAWKAPKGWYLTGMKCGGRFCDNKKYHHCKMVN